MIPHSFHRDEFSAQLKATITDFEMDESAREYLSEFGVDGAPMVEVESRLEYLILTCSPPARFSPFATSTIPFKLEAPAP